MPTLKLTKKEAASLTAKRKRDKAWNDTIQAVVDKLRPRLKATDPIEVAIVQSCLQDVRKMIR